MHIWKYLIRIGDDNKGSGPTNVKDGKKKTIKRENPPNKDEHEQEQKDKSGLFKKVLDSKTKTPEKDVPSFGHTIQDTVTRAQLGITEEPKYTQDAVVAIGYNDGGYLHMIVFDLIKNNVNIPTEISNYFGLTPKAYTIIKNRKQKNHEIAKTLVDEISKRSHSQYPIMTSPENEVNASVRGLGNVQRVEEALEDKIDLNYKEKIIPYS